MNDNENEQNIQEIFEILTECGADVQIARRPTTAVIIADPCHVLNLPGRGVLLIAFFDAPPSSDS